MAKQLNLLLEGSLDRPTGRQGSPQVGNKALEHMLSFDGCRLNQADHIGQRIKEKVRLNLSLQQTQLRLDELFFGG